MTIENAYKMRIENANKMKTENAHKRTKCKDLQINNLKKSQIHPLKLEKYEKQIIFLTKPQNLRFAYLEGRNPQKP